MSDKEDKPDNSDPVALHGVMRMLQAERNLYRFARAEHERLRGLLILLEAAMKDVQPEFSADDPRLRANHTALLWALLICQEHQDGGHTAEQLLNLATSISFPMPQHSAAAPPPA